MTTRTLWLWPGQALYVGPGLGLDEHSGSVSCLAVGLDGPFVVTANDVTRSMRSAFIPPGLKHRIEASGQMAFCYLDPETAQDRAARAMMTLALAEDISSGHRKTDELTAAAIHMTSQSEARAWVELASTTQRDMIDPRIQSSLEALKARPRTPLGELRAAAALSSSRYLHLFREQTGTTFRRYRLWIMMLQVASTIRSGGDLTMAAMNAGFASPSHFSTAFHSMFGLTASGLLATDVLLQIAD